MKKIVLTLSLFTASLFADHLTTDLKPEKTLTTGLNKIEISVKNKKEELKEGEFKLKVFMPEMPGMAYMEYEDKGVIKNGKAISNINFAMPGTWQYILKIKSEKEVETFKGSFNL